jgi:hypothetical protein
LEKLDVYFSLLLRESGLVLAPEGELVSASLIFPLFSIASSLIFAQFSIALPLILALRCVSGALSSPLPEVGDYGNNQRHNRRDYGRECHRRQIQYQVTARGLRLRMTLHGY